MAVYQIPATGVAISGLVVPGPYFASVVARPTGTSGEVSISAPASASVCATSAGNAHVIVNYLNLNTGQTGDVTVTPCDRWLDPVPMDAVAETGPGQVAMSIRVAGSPMTPEAGQPSLPGVGTFHVQ